MATDDERSTVQRWQLQLVGAPTLQCNAKTLPLELRAAALLAVLALQGPTARDLLAQWLYPGRDLAAANNNLKQLVFRLRRASDTHIVETGPTLRLGPAAVLAQTPADEPPPAGSLLDGCNFAAFGALGEWVHTERERWLLRRRRQLAELARAREAARDLPGAVVLLDRLLAEEPLDEQAQRERMRLLHLQGDRAGALRHYAGFTRQLAATVQARPDRRTRELAALIQRAEDAEASAGATTPPGPPTLPPSLLQPPRLVGREAALAQVAAAWQAGRVAWIVGEAGIGKTRLLQALAAARPGALRVAARPGDEHVPYALLGRLLRALGEPPPDATQRRELARILPELASSHPPATPPDPDRLLQAVAWRLQAAGPLRPLLLDDLHEADAPSVEMLATLVASAAEAGRAWACALRPVGGSPALPGLRAVLENAARLQPLALAPLNEDELCRLVASLEVASLDAQALSPALLRHTGGNPLFVLETLKDLVLHGRSTGPSALPRPAPVGALIERSLRQLSPAALSLARVAAIAGVDFDTRLAASVLATHVLALADPWQELQAAGMLGSEGLVHDLIREAALRTVPDGIAREVHAAVAAALQQQEGNAARIARHWLAAGRHAAAATAFDGAARQADLAGLPRQALELLRMARDCHAAVGDMEAAFAVQLDMHRPAGAVLDAEAQRALARETLSRADTPARRVQALCQAAVVANQLRDPEGALHHAEDALALAQACGDALAACNAARSKALALMLLGQPEQALAVWEPVRPHAETLLSARDFAHALGDHALMLEYAGRREEALALNLDVATRSRALGNLMGAQTATANAAIACSQLGRIAQALALAESAALLGAELGLNGTSQRLDEMNRGAMLTAAGRYGQALALLEPAADALRQAGAGGWTLMAEANLARLWLALGQPARVTQALRTAASDSDVASRLRVLLLRTRARLAAGQPPGEMLDQARQLAEASPRPWQDLFGVALDLARFAPAPEAALKLQGLVVRAGERQSWAQQLVLQACLASALADAGEPEQAHAVARAAEAMLPDVHPLELTLPETLWLLARAHGATCDPASRQRLLRTAGAWIEATARDHVAAPFRASFLERQAVNAAVLQALRAGDPGR